MNAIIKALVAIALVCAFAAAADAQTPLPSGPSTGTGYPAGASAITASSGNVAAATATATLPALVGKLTYIAGFEFTSGGATAASLITCTVTGTVSGTMSYTVGGVIGATLGNAPLIVSFVPAIPASGQNVAIVASCPTLGAGNTNATMTAFGYQQQAP